MTGTSGSFYPQRVSVPTIRATERDRDAVVDVIKASYAEGRRMHDEYDARLGHVLTAQTYAQLNTLVADLPGRPTYPDAPVAPVAATPAGSRGTNGLAVAALVCGLAQPFTGMVSTIPAIVLGHVARHQIRRTGEDGQPMATWGLALGWAGLIAVVLFVLAIVALGVVIVGAANGS